ncbi:MAG: universal stress protein [Rubrobacter sp.]|nr:universal stress protein [Rubrobacter sp.]
MSALPTTILLATDGSDEAVSAARTAAELCGKIGSELHVVHVGPQGRFIGTEVGPVFFDAYQEEEDLQKRLDEQSRKLLDEQVEKIETEGVTVTETHLGVGNQADNIVRLAEEIGADTIVMGSRGLGGVRRALMGSVSEDVVRHAHCPVLVVRGHEREALFPARIVLAVDGSRESDAATRTAAALAGGTGSELYIVHAGPTEQLPNDYPYLAENVESFFEHANEEARKFLEARAEQIREDTDAPVHIHLRPGTPEKEIVELAEEIDAGLVILGSRGLGGIRRALMGGVSNSVVRHARCPVLVVRTEDGQ